MNRLVKRLLPHFLRSDGLELDRVSHEFIGDLALSSCGIMLSAIAFGMDGFQGNPAFILIGIIAAIVAVLAALRLNDP